MSKVSVVMSVYNGERYIKESIESVLNQSEKDFEFIIIDDGSTDKSLEIIKEYEERDDRIKLISRENKGLIYSLNEGIELSNSEYIARMDCDDISNPERLEEQLKYMKENNLAICGSFAESIDKDGNEIGDMVYPTGLNNIRRFAILHNPFIHPSVMFKKSIIQKVGSYKSFFKYIEDYELWTRIIFKHSVDNIPKQLLRYRLHDNQITRRFNFKMRLIGVVVRLLSLFRFLFRF